MKKRKRLRPFKVTYTGHESIVQAKDVRDAYRIAVRQLVEDVGLLVTPAEQDDFLNTQREE